MVVSNERTRSTKRLQRLFKLTVTPAGREIGKTSGTNGKMLGYCVGSLFHISNRINWSSAALAGTRTLRVDLFVSLCVKGAIIYLRRPVHTRCSRDRGPEA
jgi:hypothetical protein